MPQTTINSFFGGQPPAEPSTRKSSISSLPVQETKAIDIISEKPESEQSLASLQSLWSRKLTEARDGLIVSSSEMESMVPSGTQSKTGGAASKGTSRSEHRTLRSPPAENMNPKPAHCDTTASYRSNENLAALAKETLSVLPGLLDKLPHVFADKCILYRLPNLTPLNPHDSPQYIPPDGVAPRTKIRVINADTFNAALELPIRISREDSDALLVTRREMGIEDAEKIDKTFLPDYGRVAILNFASDYTPGGGWLKGARAQEETLCYRSSLYFSLDHSCYPLRQLNAIYSPDVLVVRSSIDSGHKLLYPTVVPNVNDLPLVSVISVAALRNPSLRTVHYSSGTTKNLFGNKNDRELTKAKMRLTLRIAGKHNHSLVVLGALGCGAFRNPPEEIANCWSEVVREKEFTGGRFRELCFAIWDKRGEGNFEIFKHVLDGLQL